MTAARSRELVDLVAEQLERFVREGRLDPDRPTLMFGGGVYRDCLEQARALANASSGAGSRSTTQAAGSASSSASSKPS
jgi:hypothetical protein